jgi:hypothetical protein
MGSLALATQVAAGPSRPYTLRPGSDFEVGCFDPCLCPLLIVSPVEGNFIVSPLDTDAGELRYDMTDIDWFADQDGTALRVTGSGIYRIVSGPQTLHQMKLSLRVNDRPEQIFDSGLVPGGDKFPVIDIAIATNGFFCWDSVFTVHATAATVSASLPDAGMFGIVAAWPNPFVTGIALRIVLPRNESVDVRIHDAAGRVVRALASRSVLPAGVHSLEWDGRREDGSVAPAGVYLVRVTGASGHQVRAVIKTRGDRPR